MGADPPHAFAQRDQRLDAEQVPHPVQGRPFDQGHLARQRRGVYEARIGAQFRAHHVRELRHGHDVRVAHVHDRIVTHSARGFDGAYGIGDVEPAARAAAVHIDRLASRQVGREPDHGRPVIAEILGLIVDHAGTHGHRPQFAGADLVLDHLLAQPLGEAVPVVGLWQGDRFVHRVAGRAVDLRGREVHAHRARPLAELQHVVHPRQIRRDRQRCGLFAGHPAH